MSLRIVIDFAPGADREAVEALAMELSRWTRGPALRYGAEDPKVEEVAAA